MKKRTIDELLEEINHKLLKCGTIRRFKVEQKDGFKVSFYIREIAHFRGLQETIEFLENLERALKALEDYY